MKVYLAGPMTGYPQHNYPLFHETAARLRAQGYEVLSPAEHPEGEEAESLPYSVLFRRALEKLLQAEAIALLPWWRSSRGASCEHDVAQLLGLQIMYLDTSARRLRIERSVA